MGKVTLQGAPVAFGWTDALQIVLCVAVVLLALWRARRAVAQNRSGGFAARVLAPAMFFTLSFALLLTTEVIGKGGEMIVAAVATVALGVASLLLVLIIELLAWRLFPIRTRRWLGGACLLFAACFLMLPAAMMDWLQPSVGASMLGWDVLEPVALVAASAILWWSHLPGSRPGIASVFE